MFIYLDTCLALYPSDRTGLWNEQRPDDNDVRRFARAPAISLSGFLSIYDSNPSFYLHIYLSVYLSIFLSILISFYLSIFRYFYLSVYLSICFFVFVYLDIVLSFYLSKTIGLWNEQRPDDNEPSIFLSVYQSMFLSIFLCILLSIYLDMFFFYPSF